MSNTKALIKKLRQSANHKKFMAAHYHKMAEALINEADEIERSADWLKRAYKASEGNHGE